MIWDLDEMLEEISKAIDSTLREFEEGKVVTRERVYGDDRSVRITTRVKISSALSEALRPPPPLKEPLIEVFDLGERGLRVLVDLPGVRREDVRVTPLDGVLRIEVTEDGKVHRKDVALKVRPGSIQVKSAKENNSVVELTFLRNEHQKEGRKTR